MSEWFMSVDGEQLEQGDLILNCPVFDLKSAYGADLIDFQFIAENMDLIVMSQTCDLVQGREKVSEVVACAIWTRQDFAPGSFLHSNKGMEEARRGNLPAFHLLAGCEIEEFEREVGIVDFRRIHSLPLEVLRGHCLELGTRLRLLPLPPYREHLAQAFARYFMRVGLPSDIPPFR